MDIPSDANATFERYSDSASSYVVLDPHNISVFKQLYRAAKAKQKLKLRVTINDTDDEDKGPKPVTVEDVPEPESNEVAKSDTTAGSMPPVIPPSDEAGYPLFNASYDYTNPNNAVDSARDDIMSQPLKNLERLEQAMSHLQLSSAYLRNSASNLTIMQQEELKAANFAVCCNNCDRTVPDAHYHCSTCDDGDFDLCTDCVEQGITCHNDEHWLIKRFVRGDHIMVSTTERIAPKPKVEHYSVGNFPTPALAPLPAPAPIPTMPAIKSFVPPVVARTPMRTCNNCVMELPDKEFLHCTTCEDFDLCKSCFLNDKHGHHPKHGFLPAVEGTIMPVAICKRLAPGRNQRHHAICDGCDKFIFGVRHKCLDCPDWDYCADCVVNAGFVHPNHRFVPIYEQFADARSRNVNRPCHYGICCDGPLCNGARKSYIVGDRFKCTVCHDTDFCANCEASPANTHNRTHPLIKFKTPVRRVEVTTLGEDENGQKMPTMGDRLARKPVGTPAKATTPPPSYATTSLHTVVDVKPVAEKAPAAPKPIIEKAEPVAPQPQVALPAATIAPYNHADLVAVFERDTVADGTVLPPNHVFEQTWVLRNSGDVAWPAGCSVKFVGGDYMGHIDSSHPAGIHDLVSASESTICYRPLAPGQEFPFTVLLRTPAREGKIISWWRLTTKDGHKFGHRLWCDVTVQNPKVIEEPKTELIEVEEKPTEQPSPVVKTEAASPKAPQMVFPKLEKESPEASIHEEAKHETSPEEESDDFEDCGVDDEWAEESDEGFLTDEEYDILDASDEEYLDEQHKKLRK